MMSIPLIVYLLLRLSEESDDNSDGDDHQNCDAGKYNCVCAVDCHISFLNSIYIFYILSDILLKLQLFLLVRIRTEQQVQDCNQYDECCDGSDSEGYLAQNQAAQLVYD